MNRVLVSLAAVSLAALSQPAAASLVISPGAAPPAVFVVTGNPLTGTSPVTATIGDTPMVGGTPSAPVAFSDEFVFQIGPTTPPMGGTLIGTGSGSIITSTSVAFSSTDLDLTSILVNGTPVPIVTTTGGLIESAADANVPIYSGAVNTIIVNGLSRGAGSYGGNLTFIPSVPEPATWAMMLLGFGAIGFTMRKRTAKIPQLA